MLTIDVVTDADADVTLTSYTPELNPLISICAGVKGPISWRPE